jgi:hypothetical protein
MNSYSYGIEVESLGRIQDFTTAQQYALAALSRGLLDAMDQPYTHALNHKTWSSTGKVDTRYPDSFWRDRISATKPLMPKIVVPVPVPAPVPDPVIVPVENIKEPNKVLDYGSYKTSKTAVPDTKQALSIDWADITGCSFVPDDDGLVLSRTYVNLLHDGPGILRFRLLDGTGKSLFYHDYYVTEMAITKGNHLVGVNWFGHYTNEQGPLRWQIRAKGFKAATLSTRYSEWALTKPTNVV